MPTLNIKDPEARELAHELAQRTGQTMTEAVKLALREKLARERGDDEVHRARVLADVRERAIRLAALPVLDSRSADEIVGYDENGIPR